MPRLIAAAVALLAIGCARAPEVLHLSTTTSVENSGLLAVLLPAFLAETGIDVQAVAVGSGRALAILERGDVDASLTHDPDAEQRVIDAGHIGKYRKLMYNDFVIAGPPADPAGVRKISRALDAMRRIVAAGASFVSRGDSSGTHMRELALWRDAKVTPQGPALIDTGQGMAATLRIASERKAYVLTDRATLAQLGSTLQLVVLSEGDPLLINTYAILVRSGLSGDRQAHADRLFTWLTEGRGRTMIDQFRVKGQVGFIPWPLDRPHGRPSDLPNAR
jgi:tungstate transport system substrate-binding protein